MDLCRGHNGRSATAETQHTEGLVPTSNATARSDSDGEKQRRSNRRKQRARRLREEAELYVLRGAATAAGTAAITYGTIWIKAHL